MGQDSRAIVRSHWGAVGLTGFSMAKHDAAEAAGRAYEKVLLREPEAESGAAGTAGSAKLTRSNLRMKSIIFSRRALRGAANGGAPIVLPKEGVLRAIRSTLIHISNIRIAKRGGYIYFVSGIEH